jgi:hypothetical protein
MNVVGLDLGHATTVAAEHWLANLPPVPGLVACTHLVPGERPRVVITLAAPVPVDPWLPPAGADTAGRAGGEAAEAAAAGHAARQAGRAVIYPGVETLTGILTVADLLAGSAIDRIQIIGGAGADVPPDTLVDTRGFVRPQWVRGQLTLIATPAPAGRIAPFEVPNPTPCCGDHP